MTVLQTEVAEENWGRLRSAYHERVAELPPEIVETRLVQSRTDPRAWQIITIWVSAEALGAMRASSETPTGVVIFGEANAKPELSVYEVVDVAGQTKD